MINLNKSNFFSDILKRTKIYRWIDIFTIEILLLLFLCGCCHWSKSEMMSDWRWRKEKKNINTRLYSIDHQFRENWLVKKIFFLSNINPVILIIEFSHLFFEENGQCEHYLNRSKRISWRLMIHINLVLIFYSIEENRTNKIIKEIWFIISREEEKKARRNIIDHNHVYSGDFI